MIKNYSESRQLLLEIYNIRAKDFAVNVIVYMTMFITQNKTNKMNKILPLDRPQSEKVGYSWVVIFTLNCDL